MREIHELFDAGRHEIEESSSTFAFELGSEHFNSERDYEEIKVLFNLARISIENPAGKDHASEILTSDLRKISSDELEKVLDATEKAINIPVITLKALKESSAKNISRILLAADDKAPDLFMARGKKLKPARTLSRILSFACDLPIILVAALLLTLLSKYLLFPEVSLEYLDPNLIGIAALSFSLCFIFVPFISISHVGSTIGMRLFSIRVLNHENKAPRWDEAFLRAAIFPLSILSLSIISIQSGGEALHESLSGTRTVKS